MTIKENKDMVNNPPHYNKGSIEIIDFIQDWNLDFITGNIIKYVTRSPYKNKPLEDLEKAKFYLDRLIEIQKIKNIENISK